MTRTLMLQLWRMVASAVILAFAASFAVAAQDDDPAADTGELSGDLKAQEPDTDLFALISGKCSTLKVAGRDFSCRSVAYVHSLHGRAYFTIALDDPKDQSHIISFSGLNGRRTTEVFYTLPIDRMLLNSDTRPRVDGLPVPAVELSDGSCTQLGNFAAGQVSSISCKASDKKGQTYELQFESDGSPIAIRRVKPSPPTIRQRG